MGPLIPRLGMRFRLTLRAHGKPRQFTQAREIALNRLSNQRDHRPVQPGRNDFEVRSCVFRKAATDVALLWVFDFRGGVRHGLNFIVAACYNETQLYSA